MSDLSLSHYDEAILSNLGLPTPTKASPELKKHLSALEAFEKKDLQMISLGHWISRRNYDFIPYELIKKTLKVFLTMMGYFIDLFFIPCQKGFFWIYSSWNSKEKLSLEEKIINEAAFNQSLIASDSLTYHPSRSSLDLGKIHNSNESSLNPENGSPMHSPSSSRHSFLDSPRSLDDFVKVDPPNAASFSEPRVTESTLNLEKLRLTKSFSAAKPEEPPKAKPLPFLAPSENPSSTTAFKKVDTSIVLPKPLPEISPDGPGIGLPPSPVNSSSSFSPEVPFIAQSPNTKLFSSYHGTKSEVKEKSFLPIHIKPPDLASPVSSSINPFLASSTLHSFVDLSSSHLASSSTTKNVEPPKETPTNGSLGPFIAEEGETPPLTPRQIFHSMIDYIDDAFKNNRFCSTYHSMQPKFMLFWQFLTEIVGKFNVFAFTARLTLFLYLKNKKEYFNSLNEFTQIFINSQYFYSLIDLSLQTTLSKEELTQKISPTLQNENIQKVVDLIIKFQNYLKNLSQNSLTTQELQSNFSVYLQQILSNCWSHYGTDVSYYDAPLFPVLNSDSIIHPKPPFYILQIYHREEGDKEFQFQFQFYLKIRFTYDKKQNVWQAKLEEEVL